MTTRLLISAGLLACLWALPLLDGAWLGPAAGYLGGGKALAEEAKKRPRRKTRRVPTAKATTYKLLEKAQLMIDPESVPREEGEAAPKAPGTPEEAVELLEEFLEDESLNDYERALVWNTLAYAYYTLEDIPKTIDAYHQVMDQGAINLALELASLRAIFQLYYAQEDYYKSMEYMDEWTEVNGQEDPDIEYMRATAFYQLEDPDKALELALKTERLAGEQGREMKENWLYLQVVLYNEREDKEKVLSLLERIVERFTKKHYWTHLAGLYSEKGWDDKALSAYHMAYAQDFLDKESEIVALSQRLISQDNPYEASQVLARGLADGVVEENEKNVRLLATAYTMAKETQDAIAAWRKATEYAEDGEIFYRLGQALSGEERHDEAVTAYRAALDKGDLEEKEGDVRFWLGISLMQQQEWDEAVQMFLRASELDEDNADQSFRYRNYIAQEIKRLETEAKIKEDTGRPPPRWRL